MKVLHLLSGLTNAKQRQHCFATDNMAFAISWLHSFGQQFDNLWITKRCKSQIDTHTTDLNWINWVKCMRGSISSMSIAIGVYFIYLWTCCNVHVRTKWTINFRAPINKQFLHKIFRFHWRIHKYGDRTQEKKEHKHNSISICG